MPRPRADSGSISPRGTDEATAPSALERSAYKGVAAFTPHARGLILNWMKPGILLALLACIEVTAWAGCAARGAPAHADPLATDSIRARPVHRFDFEAQAGDDPALVPEELSGIVWMGDDRYLAVGDAHAAIYRLTIRVDPRTGAVLSAEVGDAMPLRDESGSRIPEPAMAEDREGIALDAGGAVVWIANEQTLADKSLPSIEGYRLADERRTRLIRCDSDSDSVLAVFAHTRPNRDFESLTRVPDGSGFWTANEDALVIDGPATSGSVSGIVRLQRLDSEMRPGSQFAYLVDPWRASIRSPMILAGREVSGLSELIALPGGRLLALERAFSGDAAGNASLRSRLYLVDPAGATDVSREPLRSGLAGKSYVPARKALLWQENWGLTNSNFEGMTLGPTLADGSRLLVLIADNNAGTSQALFTIRLTGTR